MQCGVVWRGPKNGYQEDTCSEQLDNHRKLNTQYSCFCVRMNEGDDHKMSTEKLFFNNDKFVHTSSKIMKRADATSI